MPTHSNKAKPKQTGPGDRLRQFVSLVVWLPRGRLAKRLVYGAIALVALVIVAMYGVAEWYIHSESGPQQLGVSFIPDYAVSLGVDPQATMDALINAGVRNFRLVSYWSDIEQSQGHYDFSQLDWQFQKADAAHAHIVLTLGLRQPRWPECHMPGWATNEPQQLWRAQLAQFMAAVIERYHANPALQSYQLENEYFLQGFGICDQIPGAEDRSRLVAEYQSVKRLDPHHPVIIGRSNNDIGWPVGQPQPDEFSVSVYKRVWDAGFSHRYLEYPFPSWYYGFLAGWEKIFNGKDMVIGELQAEAWPPNGQTIPHTTLAEQNKSLDAKRLQDRVQYGKASGMRQIYLWGAEYWYYRQVALHDPTLMQVAKQAFSQH